MHRRRKREHCFKKERVCSVCYGTSSTLLAGQSLKTNIVESQNRCCHDFCTTCLARKFDVVGAFPCPHCGQDVAPRTLTEKSLSEHDALRHRDIRARVGKIRNKSSTEFLDIAEWDEYLAESEDLVWNLFTSQNVQETEAELKKYERDPKNELSLNESRRTSQRAEAKFRVEQEIKLKKNAKLRAEREDAAADRGEDFVEADGGTAEPMAAPFDLALTQPTAIRCHPLLTRIRVVDTALRCSNLQFKKRSFAGGVTLEMFRSSTGDALLGGFGKVALPLCS